MKTFYIQYNIGKARYVVNHHDGKMFYKDGSKVYGIWTLKNKKDLTRMIKELTNNGYVEV